MNTTVETSAGKVEGLTRNELFVFRGIPYAAPPVGERRWLPPEPVKPWEGVLEAKIVGPVCPQPPPATNLIAGDVEREDLKNQKEDCLYLNVWTPGLDDARRPVMVWIHGGGFRTGSGSGPVYNGANLARKGDVVVVTINYRLAPYGFLNLNEITRGKIPATGHEGLLDQTAALKWVRQNIAAFGGDPDNVTIFGESAGGMSVGSLLALPAAKGLFHKAIPQSGAASTAHTLEQAVLVSEHFLDILGLKPIEVDALRDLSSGQLLETANKLVIRSQSTARELGGMPFQPAVDGKVLPQIPLDAVKDGAAKGISILVGSTLEEWNLFGALDPRVLKSDEALLRKRCRRLIPNADVEALIEVYRDALKERGVSTGPAQIFMAIQTDRIFRIPAIHLAEVQNSLGDPAYNYLFTWKSPALGGKLGACHALELGFVFGTYEERFFGSGPKADALSEAMQDAWLAFAKTGDPSCESLGKVPEYNKNRATIIFGEECTVEEAPYEIERKAWDKVEGLTAGRL